MTNNEHTVVRVGDKVCAPSKDEVKFDITSAGGVLMLKLVSPTADEKKAVRSGLAQFKLVEIDGIIFFLSRFGTLEWMDAPFHKQFCQVDNMPKPANGEGLLLHIMLVDALTGVLVEQRIIGLQHDFTTALFDMIEAQPPRNALFYTTLSNIYRERTTMDMVKSATVEN